MNGNQEPQQKQGSAHNAKLHTGTFQKKTITRFNDMERGYVKLWRKSLDSGLIQNHKVWVFWTWCLLKATHKEVKHTINMQTIILKPGQFIFGRNVAASETGLSAQTVRTCLKKLKTMQNLTIKSTNRYSVISIMNWDSYQGNGNGDQPAKQPASNQQVTSKQPASNHIQEHKNIKTEEHKKETYSRVVKYLNAKTGKKFKSTSKETKLKIDARLNDGFKPEDFKTVIDNKTEQWLHDPKNVSFLRPITLFGNKFESYLNEKPVNGVSASAPETQSDIDKEIAEAME